jgi:CheY-like chemotaxis protein
MLKSESFNVYTTDLGEEGLDLGKLYDYDIILLELNLPDISGFEVLLSRRVSKVKTPILILSGLAGIQDKVKGFGFDGDDYERPILARRNTPIFHHRSYPNNAFSNTRNLLCSNIIGIRSRSA